MKSLSKQDEARRAEIGAMLADKVDDLTKLHDAMVVAIEAFNTGLASYNETVNEAQGWVEDMANVIEEYMEGRSDKWRESEKGDAFENWKQEFENAELDEVEAVEVPELPDFSHETALQELPGYPDE